MLSLLLSGAAELCATRASDLLFLRPNVTSLLNEMPPYYSHTRMYASDGTTIHRDNSQAFNTYFKHAQHYLKPQPISTILRHSGDKSVLHPILEP